MTPKTIKIFDLRLVLVMSLMTKNETIFCIDCRTSVEQCFCVCPYCGEQKNDCFCYAVDTKDDLKNSIKHNPKSDSSKSTFQNTQEDDWWRLEKSQFERRRFS